LKNWFILLLSGWFYSANGQTIVQTLALADSLALMGRDERAIEYYERVVFFDADNTFMDSYERIAECYQRLQRWPDAERFFELAANVSHVASNQNVLVKKKVEAMLMQKKFLELRQDLFTLEQAEGINDYEYHLLMAISYFGEENFVDSKKHFLLSCKSSEQQEKVVQAFSRIDRINRLNPKTARILSMVMPGLGQLYAGDIKNGIISFGLTSGLLVLGYHAALSFGFFDAALMVLPWYQRYYFGGFKRAELIAIAKKKERRAKVYNELIPYIDSGF
jgi:tetratricopeptide (TPR) repeat protein